MAIDNTQVTRDGIEKAVKGLDGLMPEGMMSDFAALQGTKLNAGPPKMDAAQWIHDVVVDRRNGVVEHARNLKFVFEGLADTLTTVAKALVDGDATNAKNLDAGVQAINGWVVSVNNRDIPPAIPGDHWAKGKSNYGSGDTSNPNGVRSGYNTQNNGLAVRGPGEQVAMIGPPKDGLSVPGIQDDYQKIITETNGVTPKSGSANQGGGPARPNVQPINEDFVFIDGPQIVKPGDPEN